MASRTQVCNLEIQSEETLALLKARGIMTKNILLLKYQKQTIKTALNGKDGLMVVHTALRILWIYQVLPFTFGALLSN